MTFKEAAVEILRSSDKPLTAQQITRAAEKRGFLKTEGATPERTMGAQIAVDLKNRGELSDFRRVGPGKFILNREKPSTEEIKYDRIEEELSSEEEVQVEGGYIGRAGEHAVLSELLFRGYNGSLMAVDTGVDILATKDKELFRIQVKTRNISKTGRAFHFNLRIASFERHNAGNTFYVFILRNNGKLDYLILPLNEIEKSIDKEFIHKVGKDKLYRITIKKRRGSVYLGRMENDVSYYLNRWEVIK